MFKELTNDEKSILVLQDLINGIKAGEKPSFILIENEDTKAKCECNDPLCNGLRKSQATIVNMDISEVYLSCCAVAIQAESQ